MVTVNYIIVESDEVYSNVEGGVIVSDSIENVSNINRVATVLAAPDFTVLNTGDKVLVHHNIFREKYTPQSQKIKSDFFIEGNKYFVPLTEVFMYNRTGSWEALAPYCFVEPIKEEQDALSFDIRDNHKGYKRNIGKLVYSNPVLEEQGVNQGDLITFSKDSEFEFNIGGSILYKMCSKDILAVLE
mgnify:CR=1 FL=1